MSIELLNEDNMVLMSRYADKHFDLAIVDPPYGIRASEMTMGPGKKKWKKGKKWDNEIPQQEYFNELMRVSKNQIIWGGNYFPLPLTGGWLFWDKLMPEGMSFSMGELAWMTFGNTLRKITLRHHGFINGDNEKIHPTQKPTQLYKWLLDKYAKPGDKILDTHLGSGSIAIACHEYGFDLTACEIDKDYYDAAVNRFRMVTSQKSLFQAS